MMSDDLTSAEEKRKQDNKKLEKVLSTKLSINDYKTFRIRTNEADRYGAIREDSLSEMLRYIITPVANGIRKLPEFSLLKDKLYKL
jgi:hypothetical protein